VQRAIGGTLAMAAGLLTRPLTVEEIVGLLDVAEEKAA
jgi:hypothetical protein